MITENYSLAMAKSFPQRYWKEFERLALELVNDRWKLTPTKIWQTKESKDGGFDGGTLHAIADFGEEPIIHETLFEAKLRPALSSVGLRTFAATMVIAFNGRTNCLIIVSNGHFSKQALEQARDFDARARIRMILVDGASVSAWVRPRFDNLADRYPREFLSGLLLADESDERVRERIIARGGPTGTEPAARIQSGRCDDGTLARCELILDEPNESHGTIAGEMRKQLVSSLSDVLEGEAGCVMVIGEAGVGKSHLISATINALDGRLRCLGVVDLAQSSTSRQLFVTLAAQIMGVALGDVARNLSRSAASSFFSSVNGHSVPSEVKDAVIEVMTASTSVTDVDQLCLAEYLGRISAVHGNLRRFMAFHNLNQARPETLEFLASVIPIFAQTGISSIVEVTEPGDAAFMDREKWLRYIDLFKRIARLGSFRVESLELEDAIDLVLSYLPGLGRTRASFICERVGTVPLFIRSAALWLKQKNAVMERAYGVTLVEELELFFGGLRPAACIAVLDRHIDMWRQAQQPTSPYANLMSAAALLNGRLPIDAASLLLPEGADAATTFDALVATGLFLYEPGLEAVRVAHSLLLERITVTDEQQHSFRRKAVAQMLIEGISAYTDPGLSRQLCLGTLLNACEDWAAAWDVSHQAGRELANQKQLSASAAAYESALLAANHALRQEDRRASTWRIHSLLEFLQVEDARYRLGLEENLRRLDMLVAAIRLTVPPDRGPLALRVLYLVWRAQFTRENLSSALEVARELNAMISSLPSVDAEDAGRAVAALGITLKVLENEHESKAAFDKGVLTFPGSTVCRVERSLNLAAFSLRRRPEESMTYFRAVLEQFSDSLRIDKRIQVEVDLAMAQFLVTQTNEVISQAAHAIRLADTNGIPAQAARARNILGCAYWRNDRLVDAVAMFDRAALDAERSYMRRFLWRIRVNFAAAAAEYGRPAEAIANARSARDLLVKARENHWAELAAVPEHVTSRWYAALLVVGLVLARCGSVTESEALARMVKLPDFARHLRELLDGSYPAEVFTGTTSRFGERIMITG